MKESEIEKRDQISTTLERLFQNHFEKKGLTNSKIVVRGAYLLWFLFAQRKRRERKKERLLLFETQIKKEKKKRIFFVKEFFYSQYLQKLKNLQ